MADIQIKNTLLFQDTGEAAVFFCLNDEILGNLEPSVRIERHGDSLIEIQAAAAKHLLSSLEAATAEAQKLAKALEGRR